MGFKVHAETNNFHMDIKKHFNLPDWWQIVNFGQQTDQSMLIDGEKVVDVLKQVLLDQVLFLPNRAPCGSDPASIPEKSKSPFSSFCRRTGNSKKNCKLILNKTFTVID